MPADPDSPTVIFIRALHGRAPTEDQLEALDDDWPTLVKAAIDATPDNRRAVLTFIRTEEFQSARVLAILTGNPQPQDRPWPEPTPFGTPALPTFPDRALPGWIGIFVRSEARATQTPVDLAAMLALAVLSSCLAGPIVLNPWGDWIEPLNLFTIVVLPPGHRKSAIFASIVAPLHQFEAEAAANAAPILALARRRQHAAEQALTRAQDAVNAVPDDDPRRPQLLEDLDRRLADLLAAEAPAAPRLIADDCSPERLAMLLAAHDGRLAILSPEGGIFDLIAGRYSTTGAPNLDHFLKGHAGDPIVVDRVGRVGEIIPRPALTVGLAVQPEVLRGLIARPGFHGRGLLARFLYALPATTLGHRHVDLEPVHPSIRRSYHRQIRALLAFTHPHLTPRRPPALPHRPDHLPLPLGRGDVGARPREHRPSDDHPYHCTAARHSGVGADAAGKPEGRGPVGAQRRSPVNSEEGVIRAAQPREPHGPAAPESSELRGRGDEGWGEGRTSDPRPESRGEGRPSAPCASANDSCPTDPLLPLSIAMGRGPGGEGLAGAAGGASSSSFLPRPYPLSPIPYPLILPFDPDAADRLRDFAEAIEPRLAPDGDLDPIVDWASKLVGATARIAGLLHLAALDLPHPDDQSPLSRGRERGLGGEGLSGVGATSVDNAIKIAEYLIEHARAAYAAMGLDPVAANVPTLLGWIKRTGRPSFTRRDALRASPRHLRTTTDLDDALDALERHGYIRFRPQPPRLGQGRPASPIYDVHPSLVRH